MKAILKSVDALTTLVERVLAVALLFGISLNFINVVGRYVFGYALNGVDEIEIYILIWISFLGAAAVTWRGLHLRMDVLINACPAPLRFAVWLFETLVFIAVAGFVAWQSFKYVERIYALGAVSDIAHVPTWIPHSAVAVSFGLMVLAVFLRATQRLLLPAAPQQSMPENGPTR
jgi:TRAP-type C4-dicarboxylate transport system permease small subunit